MTGLEQEKEKSERKDIKSVRDAGQHLDMMQSLVELSFDNSTNRPR